MSPTPMGCEDEMNEVCGGVWQLDVSMQVMMALGSMKGR